MTATVIKKNRFLAFSLVAMLGLPGLAIAGQETMVAAAGGGTYPEGTTYAAIPINGLNFGFGLEIEDGTALGEFLVELLGVGIGGVERIIVITGKATAGVQTAANVATFSGTVTVDLGDGTPPTPNVPFTATVTTNANNEGTLGLVIGATTLPNATVNQGSMTISVPPTPTPPP